jgi:hypothetical protein
LDHARRRGQYQRRTIVRQLALFSWRTARSRCDRWSSAAVMPPRCPWTSS